MLTKLLLILIMGFSLFPIAVQSQEKATSRKIVLEDQEVTLFDNAGKESEKRIIPRMSQEYATIRRQIKEKVLKSLGIKSLAELKGNQQLAQRYFKEGAKFIKVKELNPSQLKFLDEQGKLAKEVPIGYSTYISTEGRKIERRVARNPTVASSQNVAVVSENISSFMVAESAAEEKMFDGTDGANLGTESSLEYYDVKGAMRWKKSFDSNRAVSEGHLSGNGATVAVVEGCELNCSGIKEKGVPLKRLVVFDSVGNEVLMFSLTSGQCQSYGGGLWLSQEGDYATITCLTENKIRSIVFNIREKSLWKAPYLLSIGRGEDGYEIRNGDKIKIGVTDDQMKNQSIELDIGKLSWEKLQ